MCFCLINASAQLNIGFGKVWNRLSYKHAQLAKMALLYNPLFSPQQIHPQVRILSGNCVGWQTQVEVQVFPLILSTNH